MEVPPPPGCKGCALRRISSLRRNHSQRVSKYSLARRTISCHRILMNIGLAGLSNRDSKIKLLRSLYIYGKIYKYKKYTGIFSKIRHSLPLPCRHTVYSAFISSRLNYGSEIYVKTTKKFIQPLIVT